MTTDLFIEEEREVQIIHLDQDFYVVSSDDNLYTIPPGTMLSDWHPFFVSLAAYFEHHNGEKLQCVQVFNYTLDIGFKHTAQQTSIVLIDNTAFYQQLQEIAQKRNESYIFNEILELRNQMLKESAAFKNKLLANYSMELRAPLTLISAFSSLLFKEANLPLETQQLIKAIFQQSTNLTKVLGDISGISQIQQKKKEVSTSPFSLHQLLEEIRFNYETKSKYEGFEFELTIDPGLPEFLESDDFVFNSIFTQLIENALLIGKPKSLKVNVQESHRKGLKSNIRASITLIHDLEDTKYKEEIAGVQHYQDLSEGLGYSLAQELIEILEGHIITTKPEKHLELMTINVKARIPFKKPEITTKSYSPSKTLEFKEKCKVLIAEDHKVSQFTLLKVLLQTGNFDAVVFSDPKKLLKDLEENTYDLILMSSTLSRVDAVELRSLIKSFIHNDNAKSPIIAVTANDAEKNKGEYTKAGFNAVVAQPYTEADLLNTIYKCIKVKKFK